MAVLKNITHMTAGDGQHSYAINSALQRVVISLALPVLDDALKALMFAAAGGGDAIACSLSTAKCLRIVDLGCSSGPNTVFTISHILTTIEDLCGKGDMDASFGLDIPEFEVFLNDLPGNDFNNLFKLLPGFNKQHEMARRCSWYGLPGSFYGRLFPSNSLHFAFSCYSLHWLSQVPEGVDGNNEGNIYISRATPDKVFESYAKQYQSDFTTFLNLRSKEIVCGGRMVLIIMGRRAEDHSMCEDDGAQFMLLAQSLLDMVAEGRVKKEDLHLFNLPIYFPCVKEVEAVIHAEGSFNLHKLQVIPVHWDADGNGKDLTFDKYRSGKLVAESIRAFMEPMLESHFGFGRSLVDEVFERYSEKVAEYMSIRRTDYWSIAISLCRK